MRVYANKELKQQRRRRLRKRHLKNEFALLQNLSRLFHLVQFVKGWQFFLESNSQRLYRRSGKGKESRCLVFSSSTKREIRYFHVVVIQWRQTNVKQGVMEVQSCCFSILNLFLFLPFSFTSPSSLLNSLRSRQAWKNLTFGPYSLSCLFYDYDEWQHT